jgi:hypothetical protein
MEIDLNIHNYSFEDILKLFKLGKSYTKVDLIESEKMVSKMHPDNSLLDKKYYDLFVQAYDILKEELNKKQMADEIQSQIELYKMNQRQMNDRHYLINADTSPSCYKPSNYIIQIASIHTEDRDILKYPFQNNFEVELPQVFKNVLSLELYDITLPTYYYNISNVLQNTALWFSVPVYFEVPIELRLMSGFYDTVTFTQELTKALNEATTKRLYELHVYELPTSEYKEFSVSLNKYSNKLEIYNNKNEFQLWCEKKSVYNDCLYDNWDMLIDWGLPYNMGFYKKCYISEYDEELNIFRLVSPKIINISINNTIYMEIDKFNYINEINPFSINSSGYYNNDYNGMVNSAFAKLILSNVTNTYVPVKKFKRELPHIEEKIAKLKFRFRYHNGNLVDFLQQEFNFSIKMECRFNCKYTT